MTLQKGISVIIPVYNAEKYLRTCVASLILQTFKDLELIFVIDKNSSDNSENVLKELLAKTQNIKIIYGKDGCGAGYNRNIAIKEATREFIGFVDADDCINKDYYEKLYNNAIKHNADISMGTTVILNEERQIVEVLEYPYTTLEGIGNIYPFLKCFTCWDKIYKTELVQNDKNIRFAEGVIHEDNVFALNIFYKANKLVTTPDAHYYWLRRANSVTMTTDEHWLNDANIVFNQVLDKLSEFELSKEDKFKIVIKNIGAYAIDVFNNKELYNYYRNKLPFIIGKDYTYELIYKMENHIPFN